MEWELILRIGAVFIYYLRFTIYDLFHELCHDYLR